MESTSKQPTHLAIANHLSNLDNLNIPAFVIGNDYLVKDINTPAAQLHGVVAGAIIGKNYLKFCKVRKIGHSFLLKELSKVTPENSVQVNTQYKSSEGDQYIKWTISALDTGAQEYENFLFLGKDITQETINQANLQYAAKVAQDVMGQYSPQRETVEGYVDDIVFHLDNIIGQIPGSLYWKDKEGIYLGGNNHAAELAGLASRREFLGKTDSDFAHKFHWSEKIAKSWAEDDKQVAAGVKIINREESPFVAGTNKEIFQLTNRVPLNDREGNIIGILGISIDIADRKRAEKLTKEKRVTEATNERLKAIAGSIAHQMTDPLGAVKIASDFNYGITKKLIDNYQKSVRKECIEPNIPEEDIRIAQWYGEQIQFLIKQTGFIINNHLINIKHNSWHTETDWTILKPESINEIVDKALREHPLTEQQRTLMLWQKGKDFEVLGIDSLIAQVISNLLNNALGSIQRAKRGQITIWLEHDDKFNYLHIRDTGEGLPREGRDELFKPFQSGHKNGTGLGLYFCKSVMEGYHGDIICRGKKEPYPYAQFTLQFLKCEDARKKYLKKVKTLKR